MRFEVQDKRQKKNVGIEFAYIKCFRCNNLCCEKIAPNVIIVSFMFEVDSLFYKCFLYVGSSTASKEKKKKGARKSAKYNANHQ